MLRPLTFYYGDRIDRPIWLFSLFVTSMLLIQILDEFFGTDRNATKILLISATLCLSLSIPAYTAAYVRSTCVVVSGSSISLGIANKAALYMAFASFGAFLAIMPFPLLDINSQSLVLAYYTLVAIGVVVFGLYWMGAQRHSLTLQKEHYKYQFFWHNSQVYLAFVRPGHGQFVLVFDHFSPVETATFAKNLLDCGFEEIHPTNETIDYVMSFSRPTIVYLPGG